MRSLSESIKKGILEAKDEHFTSISGIKKLNCKEFWQPVVIGGLTLFSSLPIVYHVTGNGIISTMVAMGICSITGITSFLVGRYEDGKLSLSNLFNKKTTEKLEVSKIDESVEVLELEPDEPEQLVIDEPSFVEINEAEEWEIRGQNLKDALYEYMYSGNDRICVEIVHYSDDAPQVEEFQIIPIKESHYKNLHLYDDLNSSDINVRRDTHREVVRRGANLEKIGQLGENLSRDLGLSKGVKISIDLNIGGGKAAIYLPKEVREWVYTADYLDDIAKSDAILPLFMGKGFDKKPTIVDLVEAPHQIIGGSTKSGKTIEVLSQLLGLAYSKSPDHVKFTLIDPKVTGLAPIGGLPHCTSRSITNMTKAMIKLEELVGLMHERNELLESSGVQDIQEFNELNDEKLDYHIIVCDEFLMALADEEDVFDSEGNPISRMTVGKRIAKLLSDICIMGRSTGFHFIGLTQRFAAEDIPGKIRSNIGMGTCLSVRRADDSKMIINQAGGENLLKYGDSLVTMDGWDFPLRLQAGGFRNKSTEMRELVEMITRKWHKESVLEEKELFVIGKPTA